MAARKDKKVGEVFHERSRTRVDIMLTPDLKFKASYGGQTFGADSKQVLESHVLKAIRDSLDVEWIPVIWIRRYDSGLRIERDRFYVARLPSGAMKKCRWLIPDGLDRFTCCEHLVLRGWGAEKTFTLPSGPLSGVSGWGGGSIEHYLPYSEAIWQGLDVLEARIEQARAMLDQLLSTDEGLRRLEAAGLPLLLPAPGDEPTS